MQVLKLTWHQTRVFISITCDRNEREEQSFLRIACRSTSFITQLLLTSDDPMVLSSALSAYATCCDTSLAISSTSTSTSEPFAEELLSWMRVDGVSISVMKVMIRCYSFHAVHTIRVAAMKAMTLICTSILKHHNSDKMPAIISDIVFSMLKLVLDTSHIGERGGDVESTPVCDKMKEFNSCINARLNCASSFPWLLTFARIEASDTFKSAGLSLASAAATSPKFHYFMMSALCLSESSIFAPDPKTRSLAVPLNPIVSCCEQFFLMRFYRTAAAECLYTLVSSGWLGPQWLPHSRLFNCGKVGFSY
jgi:hypothetical protein